MTVNNERAQKIVEEYRLLFEGGDEIVITQILGDLIEWCDGQTPRISFELMAQDAREMLRNIQ